MSSITQRIDRLPWNEISGQLHARGFAMLPALLTADDCAKFRNLYSQSELFRKRIVMEKHGYGRGEYQYFAYPLPEVVQQMRQTLYPFLATVANDWYAAMKLAVRFPAHHEEFIERCHAAGQLRPTPLMLKYGKDDFNCLHQDLYGEHLFPLQVVFLLSDSERDFTGGEFLLTEQRPRMQSRAEVIPLRQGDAVIFGVNQRPTKGSRGYYRVTHRHGVSILRSGERFTLGIIFHDAK